MRYKYFHGSASHIVQAINDDKSVHLEDILWQLRDELFIYSMHQSEDHVWLGNILWQ